MAKTRRTTTSRAGGKAKDPLTLVDLTPDEVKRLPHPRDGFEAHIEPLLALYQEHRDELASRAVDAAEVRARFTAWRALAAIEASARKHLEMVEETRLLHASKVWSAMLEVYAKARAAARTNPDVARGIADFARFMSLGPRKKPGPPR